VWWTHFGLEMAEILAARNVRGMASSFQVSLESGRCIMYDSHLPAEFRFRWYTFNLIVQLIRWLPGISSPWLLKNGNCGDRLLLFRGNMGKGQPETLKSSVSEWLTRFWQLPDAVHFIIPDNDSEDLYQRKNNIRNPGLDWKLSDGRTLFFKQSVQ